MIYPVECLTKKCPSLCLIPTINFKDIAKYLHHKMCEQLDSKTLATNTPLDENFHYTNVSIHYRDVTFLNDLCLLIDI